MVVADTPQSKKQRGILWQPQSNIAENVRDESSLSKSLYLIGKRN